jgi:hypothetical protein
MRQGAKDRGAGKLRIADHLDDPAMMVDILRVRGYTLKRAKALVATAMMSRDATSKESPT